MTIHLPPPGRPDGERTSLPQEKGHSLDCANAVGDCCILVAEENSEMTYMDIAYRYGATPGEREMRAIDGMREVYGIRKVDFQEKDKTVRVEYDASRLNEGAVAKLLRQAGIDVRELLALA